MFRGKWVFSPHRYEEIMPNTVDKRRKHFQFVLITRNLCVILLCLLTSRKKIRSKRIGEGTAEVVTNCPQSNPQIKRITNSITQRMVSHLNIKGHLICIRFFEGFNSG